METAGIAGLLVIGFMLGKIYERWASGEMDIEGVAYFSGRERGYCEGYDDARAGFPHQPPVWAFRDIEQANAKVCRRPQ